MTYKAFPFRAPGRPNFESYDLASGVSAGEQRASAIVTLESSTTGTTNDTETWPAQHYMLVGLTIAIVPDPVAGTLTGGNAIVSLKTAGNEGLSQADTFKPVAPVLHWPAGGVQEFHHLLADDVKILTDASTSARLQLATILTGPPFDTVHLYAYLVALAAKPTC